MEKSLYLRDNLTDFDKIWYDDALRPSGCCWQLKILEFESPRWPPATIWKNGKIVISSQQLDSC